MKDATGELSMTAVAVVAIAAIGVLFSTLIWPSIKKSIMRSTYCSQAFGCTDSGEGDSLVNCYVCVSDDVDDGGDAASQIAAVNCAQPTEIQCPKNAG